MNELSMTDSEWQEACSVYNNQFTRIKPDFYNTSFPVPRDEIEQSMADFKVTLR